MYIGLVEQHHVHDLHVLRQPENNKDVVNLKPKTPAILFIFFIDNDSYFSIFL